VIRPLEPSRSWVNFSFPYRQIFGSRGTPCDDHDSTPPRGQQLSHHNMRPGSPPEGPAPRAAATAATNPSGSGGQKCSTRNQPVAFSSATRRRTSAHPSFKCRHHGHRPNPASPPSNGPAATTPRMSASGITHLPRTLCSSTRSGTLGSRPDPRRACRPVDTTAYQSSHPLPPNNALSSRRGSGSYTPGKADPPPPSAAAAGSTRSPDPTGLHDGADDGQDHDRTQATKAFLQLLSVRLAAWRTIPSGMINVP
jgi:hypothetical protein